MKTMMIHVLQACELDIGLRHSKRHTVRASVEAHQMPRTPYAVEPIPGLPHGGFAAAAHSLCAVLHQRTERSSVALELDSLCAATSPLIFSKVECCRVAPGAAAVICRRARPRACPTLCFLQIFASPTARLSHFQG